MLDHNQHIWSQKFSAVIGAYDIEAGYQLSLFVSHPDHGNVSLTLGQSSMPEIKPCPHQLLVCLCHFVIYVLNMTAYSSVDA